MKEPVGISSLEVSMATVRLEHIYKKFGKVDVIKDISLETKEGEFSFILGPSGAGKTTILNLITGILPLSGGSIYINDKPMAGLKPKDRDVAIAFESYALYPNKTVYGNIRFPLDAPIRKSELSEHEKDERVRQIAKLLQIEELLQRLPKELSGGQRQRVALGRTLVRRPQVYLLDEPIAHLDAKLRHQMRGELKRLQQELRIPVLCASPDQSEAVAMADRIYVLHEGQIEQVGTPKDVYFHPVNEFVARILGEPKMSIFTAAIQQKEGKHIIMNDDITMEAPAAFSTFLSSAHIPNQVDIGIRHTDIDLSFTKKDDGFIPFTIDFYQINGEKLIITAVNGTTSIVVENPYTAGQKVQIGDPIWLKWDTENFYLFDQKTKMSLL